MAIPVLCSLLIFYIPIIHSLRLSKTLDVSVTVDVPKSLFPVDFVWGTSTSAFQVEGAWNVSGRGLSVWDSWTFKPGTIVDGSTAEIANDDYHRYNEDLDLLKGTGFQAYRFSISWSRIFPGGEGAVNQEGIDFYNTLIDAIISRGLEPYATLHHFDMPQQLEDKYLGWLNKTMIGIFENFADVCFANFGDRVKKWITLNELGAQAGGGWGSDGHFPPGRCSNRTACTYGNSSIEPYVVVHNMLNAHAAVVKLYNNKYRTSQAGQLGIAEIATWYEPASNSTADKEAAERALLFQNAWIFDPIFKGDYPVVMRKLLGERLPTFTTEEIRLLNNSADFIGINHYLIEWVTDYAIVVPPVLIKPGTDRLALTTSTAPDTVPNHELYYAFSPDCAFGIAKILHWIGNRYPSVDIYVTENGYEDQVVPTNLQAALTDNLRVEYYQAYLKYVIQALRNGVNLKGYFAWAFMDNFEWNFGYTSRYGLYYVERKDRSLKRYQKRSGAWFERFLRGSTY